MRELVESLLRHEPAAAEKLYRLVARLSRKFLRPALDTNSSNNFEDTMHDVYICVYEKIIGGFLHTPDALPAFICSVCKMTALARRSRRSHPRTMPHLEVQEWSSIDYPTVERGLHIEQTILTCLKFLDPISRDLIVRFYILEQSPEHIQKTLGISPTKYRDLKSRSLQFMRSRCDTRNRKHRTDAATRQGKAA